MEAVNEIDEITASVEELHIAEAQLVKVQNSQLFHLNKTCVTLQHEKQQIAQVSLTTSSPATSYMSITSFPGSALFSLAARSAILQPSCTIMSAQCMKVNYHP